MLCKTKRQQQVNKIPRKKGRYVSQVITEETTIKETETAEESEKWLENDIIEEEGGVFGDLTECEAVENWTEENLKEFEEVGNRFITEALHWHDGAANSIRAVLASIYWKVKNYNVEKEKREKEIRWWCKGNENIWFVF